MSGRIAANLLLALFASISASRADDWYVDNVGGNDESKGTFAERPLQTIQAALLRARPGDRIILRKRDEPYREQISITGASNSGMESRPLEIVGNGAVLEGAEPIRGEDWESIGNDQFQFRPPRLSHQMLFLDGKPLERVESDPGQIAQLKPLQWTQRDGWIIFCTEPGRAPYQYNLSCCIRTVGITVYEAHDVLISDVVVQGFQFDGINAHDLADRVTISGCILRGNGRSGLSIGGASNALVAGCLIGDNGQSQVRSEGFCQLQIDSCDILEQPARIPIDHQGGKITRDGAAIRP
jgi:hypothetical protein